MTIKKFYDKGSRYHIHNTSFSLKLTKHYKLEFYVTPGRKGLLFKNTLASWANLKVTKEMKGCVYDPQEFKLRMGHCYNRSSFKKVSRDTNVLA